MHFRQTPFLSNSRFGIRVEEMALIHIELDIDIIPCGIIIRRASANHQLMTANGGVEHELRTGQFGYADFRRDIFTATASTPIASPRS